MSKAATWYAAWWDIPANRRMHPYAKLLYTFLKTGRKSMSGIYTCDPGEIEFYTGVPEGDCLHLLANGLVVNVEYDEPNYTCFVVDKFRDQQRMGGNQAWVVKGLLNEYYDSWKARVLWLRFFDVYREYVNADPVLSTHASELLVGDASVFPTRSLPNPKSKKETTDEDYETTIVDLLCRYPKDLDPIGADIVLEAYGDISKEMKKSARVTFLKKLEAYPADAVAFAAKKWLEDQFPGRRPSVGMFLNHIRNLDAKV